MYTYGYFSLCKRFTFFCKISRSYVLGLTILKYKIIKFLLCKSLIDKFAFFVNCIQPCKLETFINIANVLEVSTDVLLADVLSTGYKVKTSLLSEKIDNLSASDRDKVYAVVLSILHFIVLFSFVL